MSLPIRAYISTLTFLTRKLCQFITTHRATLIKVVNEVLPAQSAPFVEGLDAIITACGVFELVYAAWTTDPND